LLSGLDESIGHHVNHWFILDQVKGSHHTYKHPSITAAFLQLQPDSNNEAKPYQIKQFLSLVEEYNLRLEGTEEEPDESDE
jgi:hypothetical protein